MVRIHKHLDPAQTGREAESLDSGLRRRIVGQEEAVNQIVNIYQCYLAGMASPDRPVGNFLFLGPTGSGKTRLVEATAETLLGDARAVVKIDCAEFQHSHEIAKLIGSPPGYLGHRETHPLLSQETINKHQTEKIKLSFILFDEIEKASDALWNLLLGVLDKATLTLGDNRRVDFSRAMIFMTSNLGAAEMGSILRPNLGFAASEEQRGRISGEIDAATGSKIARAGIEAARRKFTPEFMNRIDKTVVFKPLAEAELRKILDLELNIVQQRVLQSSGNNPFIFALSAEAKQFLLEEGTDVTYGARHLKRAIERSLVHPLSNLIATGQLRSGDLVKIDFDTSDRLLTFVKEAEDMPVYALAQMSESDFSAQLAALAGSLGTEPARAALARGSRRT
ncbi:MAG: ATP-dependent Clp protease ATP-binding subunit [Bryobacterales bacterium]|nr:ATP-dependent Clp protease ATP-binding subunit [Bryobacterales bacterium]